MIIGNGRKNKCIVIVWGVALILFGVHWARAQPAQAASLAFDRYVTAVERRIDSQHAGRDSFVAGIADAGRSRQLRSGEIVVEPVSPPGASDLPGALLHHWRGTAFVRGADAGQFERLLRGYAMYPKVFAPEVLDARMLQPGAEQPVVAGKDKTQRTLQVSMRVRQKHVLTVVMDSSYEVSFARPVSGEGCNSSRSIRISEIERAGTEHERVLPDAEAHGFLWRQNSYWSYVERDGGLYIQIESVSLSRSIPAGLGWAVRPFVESVPRESLEFTLRSAAAAMAQHGELAQHREMAQRREVSQ